MVVVGRSALSENIPEELKVEIDGSDCDVFFVRAERDLVERYRGVIPSVFVGVFFWRRERLVGGGRGGCRSGGAGSENEGGDFEDDDGLHGRVGLEELKKVMGSARTDGFLQITLRQRSEHGRTA